MNFEKVRETVEDYAAGICSDVNAPASHLPERVVDWIAQAFMNDYLDEGEERLPDYNDVLKGMCDYLQEECSEEAVKLRDNERKIEEIKNSLDCLGYDPSDFSDSELLEIYNNAYDSLANNDSYSEAYNQAVIAAVENL